MQRAWLIVFVVCLPLWGFAHGGEDHVEKAPTPLSTQNGIVASATGSVFEVVVKAPQITPGEPTTLRVLLSDSQSNAPIPDASIEINIKSQNGVLQTVKAMPSKSVGVYEVSAMFPSVGAYVFDLTIQGDNRADLLVVSGFQVSEIAEENHARSASNPLVLLSGAGGIFVVALVLGFVLGRRRTMPTTENAS